MKTTEMDFWDKAEEDLKEIRTEWEEARTAIAARDQRIQLAMIHASYVEHITRHIAAMALTEGATGMDLSRLATEMYHEKPTEFQSHMYRVALLASFAALTWERLDGALKAHAPLDGFDDEDWEVYSCVKADMEAIQNVGK